MSKHWGVVGEQGVSLVIAELLARDFQPYRPVIDDHGVDLMLSNGLRIQVKTASTTEYDSKKTYQYSLCKRRSQADIREGKTSPERRDVAAEADFIILVGLNDRRFWIVPTAFLDGCSHITIVQKRTEYKNGIGTNYWKAVCQGEGRWDRLVYGRLMPTPNDKPVAVSDDDNYDNAATFAGWGHNTEETLQ